MRYLPYLVNFFEWKLADDENKSIYLFKDAVKQGEINDWAMANLIDEIFIKPEYHIKETIVMTIDKQRNFKPNICPRDYTLAEAYIRNTCIDYIEHRIRNKIRDYSQLTGLRVDNISITTLLQDHVSLLIDMLLGREFLLDISAYTHYQTSVTHFLDDKHSDNKILNYFHVAQVFYSDCFSRLFNRGTIPEEYELLEPSQNQLSFNYPSQDMRELIETRERLYYEKGIPHKEKVITFQDLFAQKHYKFRTFVDWFTKDNNFLRVNHP